MHLYLANAAESHVGPPDWDWERDYENPSDWGLGDATERVIGDGIVFITVRS
jgi:hypothetical protein